MFDEGKDLNSQTGIEGIVYEISNTNNEKKYIGSTTNFQQRIKLHLSKYNTSSSKIIIEAGNYNINIIEKGKYDNLEALRKKERFYIELQPELVVNKVIPGRTIKEYRVAYLAKNRDRINADKRVKINCDVCDKPISKVNIATHRKTLCHQKKLEEYLTIKEAINQALASDDLPTENI